jgi:hypothetical protein
VRHFADRFGQPTRDGFRAVAAHIGGHKQIPFSTQVSLNVFEQTAAHLERLGPSL